MYGYQLIENMTAHRFELDMRIERIGGGWLPVDVEYAYRRPPSTLTDFLDGIGTIETTAPDNQQYRVLAEIPYTVHDERTGEGDLNEEANAYVFIDEFEDDVTVTCHHFSKTIWVTVYDGAAGGIFTNVPDDLAELITELLEYGYLDKPDAHAEVRNAFMWKNWYGHVEGEVLVKLSDQYYDAWKATPLEHCFHILESAVGQLDNPNEFEGTDWLVDPGELAQSLTVALGQHYHQDAA